MTQMQNTQLAMLLHQLITALKMENSYTLNVHTHTKDLKN